MPCQFTANLRDGHLQRCGSRLGRQGRICASRLSHRHARSGGPVPSLRLKSFRAGQQLTEYLTLYAALSGQSRAAIGAALLADAGLRPATEKSSEADAGTARFGPEARPALATLRQRLGAWLDARAPAPRPRWHDPRPAVRDPDAVRAIPVLPAP